MPSAIMQVYKQTEHLSIKIHKGLKLKEREMNQFNTWAFSRTILLIFVLGSMDYQVTGSCS